MYRTRPIRKPKTDGSGNMDEVSQDSNGKMVAHIILKENPVSLDIVRCIFLLNKENSKPINKFHFVLFEIASGITHFVYCTLCVVLVTRCQVFAGLYFFFFFFFFN